MNFRAAAALAAVFSGLASLLAAPSRTCAPCHQSICDTYQRTAMANSSGRVGGGPGLVQEDFTRANFLNAATGFRYSVSRGRDAFLLQLTKTAGRFAAATASAPSATSRAKSASFAPAPIGTASAPAAGSPTPSPSSCRPAHRPA